MTMTSDDGRRKQQNLAYHITPRARYVPSERGVYEISVRSMNIDDRPTDLMANSHVFQKIQMAITLQRVIRSTSCLF